MQRDGVIAAGETTLVNSTYDPESPVQTRTGTKADLINASNAGSLEIVSTDMIKTSKAVAGNGSTIFRPRDSATHGGAIGNHEFRSGSPAMT